MRDFTLANDILHFSGAHSAIPVPSFSPKVLNSPITAAGLGDAHASHNRKLAHQVLRLVYRSMQSKN